MGELMKPAKEYGFGSHDKAEQSEGHDILSRFGLGTAQLGMPYGRFNKDGVPSKESALSILRRAGELNLSTIDTAHLYGESELVLGTCSEHLKQFDVITKTPHFSNEVITKTDARYLREAFNNSLRLLRLPSIYGLLIHDANNLLAPGGEHLYAEMQALQNEGRVQYIGVSAYSGGVVQQILEEFDLDIVQLPINLVDRRLIDSGLFSRLASSGIEIHARSVFLQGLLLADPRTLTSHFNSAKPVITRFHAAARAAGMSPAHVALHYLLSIAEIRRIIVGVESIQQLEQLFNNFPPPPQIDYSEFRIDEMEILNPALWVSGA